MGSSWTLTLLAEAYEKAGRPDEAMNALGEALALVAKNNEHLYEAEIYRFKGELLIISSSKKTEGEACFRYAIDVARKQAARSWELRATTSLARLLRQQGKKGEARNILAEIYGWFTEGFDTADLKDAKTLLGELS